MSSWSPKNDTLTSIELDQYASPASSEPQERRKANDGVLLTRLGKKPVLKVALFLHSCNNELVRMLISGGFDREDLDWYLSLLSAASFSILGAELSSNSIIILASNT